MYLAAAKRVSSWSGDAEASVYLRERKAKGVGKMPKSSRGMIEIVETGGLCLKAGTWCPKLGFLCPARFPLLRMGMYWHKKLTRRSSPIIHPAYSEEQAPFRLCEPDHGRVLCGESRFGVGDVTVPQGFVARGHPNHIYGAGIGRSQQQQVCRGRRPCR
jgi:hypothetical protein